MDTSLNTANGNSNPAKRFHCKVEGCGKSFARKEHLARHARSHSAHPVHICQICLREFTRSDSLARHLVRHGDSFKPSPSGRSKHACAACHASKIKCDGNQPCSACKRKRAECRYEQRESDDQDSLSNNESDNQRRDSHPPVESSRGNNHSSEVTGSSKNINSNEASLSPSRPKSISQAFRARSNGPIDWSSMRIEKDPPDSMNVYHPPIISHSHSDTREEDIYPLPPATTKQYIDYYYDYFHYRWPIIHIIQFDNDKVPPVLVSSMSMIGAWHNGTHHSRWIAMDIHERLMGHIIPRLLQVTSADRLLESLPVALCQATLLNIIFGLYCGVEKIISKVIILRNIVVSVLREVGFFKPEIPFDNPEVFLPLRTMRIGERQRLAAYLFKIDSYFNILRSQPAILTAEEMFFTLPQTFSLHNANGLHIFETRYSIEPTIRRQTTICDMIQDTALDSAAPIDGLMLAEDIQLGICALQSRLWHLSARMTDAPDLSNAIELDSLRRRLESWKRLLSRIPTAEPDTSEPYSREIHMAMRYYYGRESHSQPGWQTVVCSRQRGLVFDANILYELVSLHLSGNIGNFNLLALETLPGSSNRFFGDAFREASQRREESTREWTQTANSRRALCHAAAVLASYNSLPAVVNQTVDPIIYVALSVGALVVWAYGRFSTPMYCEICTPGSRVHFAFAELPDVELTKWSDIKAEPSLEKEKETWVEVGGGRITLNDTKLCRCNLEYLVSRFHSCLPGGWDVADTICPGISKVPDTRMEI